MFHTSRAILCRSLGMDPSVNRISWHRSLDISPIQFMSTIKLSIRRHHYFIAMHACNFNCRSKYPFSVWMGEICGHLLGRYVTTEIWCVSVSVPIHSLLSITKQFRTVQDCILGMPSDLDDSEYKLWARHIEAPDYCSHISLGTSGGAGILSLIVNYQFWKQKPSSILIWYTGSIQEQWLWWGQ